MTVETRVNRGGGLDVTGWIEIHGSIAAAEYNGSGRYDVGKWDLL